MDTENTSRVEFDVCGPFDVRKEEGPRGGVRYRAVLGDKRWPELASAVGCYVYALKRERAGKATHFPVYVGMTVASFEQEIFQPHKEAYLDEVLSEHRGSLAVFLFPVIRRRGAVPKKVIAEVETHLIRECKELNDGLKNKRKIGRRNWLIKDVTSSKRGRRPKAADAYWKMWD